MNELRAFALAAIAIIAVIAGYAAFLAAEPPAPQRAAIHIRPVWTEVRWPFPLDQWGQGRAFRCEPIDCGSEINLYLRAKIGFCNCATGVADDESSIEWAMSISSAAGVPHAAPADLLRCAE